MNVRLITRLFLDIITIILAGACAKISAPTGGKKDNTPPVMIKSLPDSATTNFKGKNLVFTFNEYVALDNINNKFIVSPPMKKKPRVFIKGKSVVTEFAENLKDSSTYTFNYQDGIKDLNEGNKIKDFQFVLSTGPVIDSLSVTGNVYNALNLEIPEKTHVLLYRELADSAVEKHIPYYMGLLDKTGYFRINNIGPGKYRLYALKDADNSKTYNLAEEEFAFLNQSIEVTPETNFLPVVKDTTKPKKVEKKIPITPAKNITPGKKEEIKEVEPPPLIGQYQLALFTAMKKNHYLTSSSRALKYQLFYTLSLPPDSMKFEFSIPGYSENTYLLERSRKNDSLLVWITDSSLYAKQQIETVLKYPLTDSLGKVDYKSDTVKLRFTAPKLSKGAKPKRIVYAVETNIVGGFIKPGLKIVLKSPTPFLVLDTSKIRLYDVTDPVMKKIDYSLYKDSTNASRYFINADLVTGKKYLYTADSASFVNIFSEATDSTGTKFSVKDPSAYCKLTLNLTNYEGALIVHLLKPDEKVLSEIRTDKSGKVVFPLLDPGSYRLRVIYDLNGDGQWTPGDFATGRQPEPVTYYKSEIEIKAVLEGVEQDWALGEMNFKDYKLRKKITPK